VRSETGALHIVAIWQALSQFTDKIACVTAHVDAGRGAECLTIEIADVGESQLDGIAISLKQSPWLMTATIEPTQRAREQAARDPA